MKKDDQTKKEMQPKYDKKFLNVKPKMKKSDQMAEDESLNKLKICKEAGPEIDYLEKNEGKKIIGKKYIPKSDSTKDLKYLKKKKKKY